jgi:eukaryotic-like serine/threonine-protein kinase
MTEDRRQITLFSSTQTGSTGAPSKIHQGGSAYRSDSESTYRRVAFLALFYAIAFSLAFGVGLMADGRLSWKLFTVFRFNAAFVSILSALAIFCLARWRLVSEKTLTNITLIWLTPAVLGIMVAEGWSWVASEPDAFEMIVEKKMNIGISWACVTITIFPLLVRASVLQVSIASFAAACTAPGLLLGYQLYYGVSLPFRAYLGFSLAFFICAGVAIVHGLLLVRTRQDLDKARQLGSYSLEDRLGKGGMGEVWRARHRMLVRPAAIKLIKPAALGSVRSGDSSEISILRRFEREVQATASLQSPHTISVYDFGTTDQNSFYYVMELLDGLDLKSLVERFGPLPEGRVVNLLAQACDSLAEAHQRGLIHRDIKPANIFICRLGLHFDFIKVLDFGLVKTAEDAKHQESQLTTEGVATGTPAYMAPEVAMARPELDARLDIYSLGCVAYWLTTGHDVFEADTPMAVALKHIQEKPVLPSSRTELALTPEFEKIITSCLDKDPDGRPQSALELAGQLRECQVADRWDRERTRSWWEIHLPEVAGREEQPV